MNTKVIFIMSNLYSRGELHW